MVQPWLVTMTRTRGVHVTESLTRATRRFSSNAGSRVQRTQTSLFFALLSATFRNIPALIVSSAL